MIFLPRNNYAAARLQGLEEDLHLTGDEYQVGLSILFVAYVSGLSLIQSYSRSSDWLANATGSHASAFQPPAQLQWPSILVSGLLRRRLGPRLGLDEPGEQLWTNRRLQVYPGSRW